LHAITQKPLESVKQFVVRLKAAIDVFDITEPQGTLFHEFKYDRRSMVIKSRT